LQKYILRIFGKHLEFRTVSQKLVSDDLANKFKNGSHQLLSNLYMAVQVFEKGRVVQYQEILID